MSKTPVVQWQRQDLRLDERWINCDEDFARNQVHNPHVQLRALQVMQPADTERELERLRDLGPSEQFADLLRDFGITTPEKKNA
jgi:3-mercaptopyruvate sulfurtransferase SseA